MPAMPPSPMIAIARPTMKRVSLRVFANRLNARRETSRFIRAWKPIIRSVISFEFTICLSFTGRFAALQGMFYEPTCPIIHLNAVLFEQDAGCPGERIALQTRHGAEFCQGLSAINGRVKPVRLLIFNDRSTGKRAVGTHGTLVVRPSGPQF